MIDSQKFYSISLQIPLEKWTRHAMTKKSISFVFTLKGKSSRPILKWPSICSVIIFFHLYELFRSFTFSHGLVVWKCKPHGLSLFVSLSPCLTIRIQLLIHLKCFKLDCTVTWVDHTYHTYPVLSTFDSLCSPFRRWLSSVLPQLGQVLLKRPPSLGIPAPLDLDFLYNSLAKVLQGSLKNYIPLWLSSFLGCSQQ